MNEMKLQFQIITSKKNVQYNKGLHIYIYQKIVKNKDYYLHYFFLRICV